MTTPVDLAMLYDQGLESLLVEVYDGEALVGLYPLGTRPLVIGRDPTRVDVCLFDPDINRVHATIERAGAVVWVVDHSAGGTGLGAIRVRFGQRVQWHPDERLRVGRYGLRIIALSSTPTPIRWQSGALYALLFVRGPRVGQIWQVRKPSFTIGWQATSDGVLADCEPSSVQVRHLGDRWLLGAPSGEVLLRKRTTDVELTEFTPWSPMETLCMGPHGLQLVARPIGTQPAGITRVGGLVARSAARREVLTGLVDWANTGMSTPLCVTGPTGSGKTAAARAAHRLRHPSGSSVLVHELSVDASTTLKTCQRRMGKPCTLLLDGIEQLDPQVLTGLLQSHERNKHVNLVFLGTEWPGAVPEPAQMTHLSLPSLTDTPSDIGLLASARLQHHVGHVRLSAEAVAWLVEQPWPGEVAQLDDVIRTSAVATGIRPGAVLTPLDIVRGTAADVLQWEAHGQSADALMATGHQLYAGKRLGIPSVAFRRALRSAPRALWGTPWSTQKG